MTKNTPGPWRYTHDAGDHFSLNGQDGESIIAGCGCCGSPFLGGKDVEANARLIAAAPDLLDALQRLDRNGHTEATWDFAKRAIAKATGETP